MELPQTATLAEAAALADLLPTQLAQGSGPLRVQAAALKSFDSSTIALLLQAQRLAKAAGRACEISDLPAPLLALARIYGVEALLSGSSASAGADPA